MIYLVAMFLDLAKFLQPNDNEAPILIIYTQVVQRGYHYVQLYQGNVEVFGLTFALLILCVIKRYCKHHIMKEVDDKASVNTNKRKFTDLFLIK